MDNRRETGQFNTANVIPFGRRATVVDLELARARPVGEEDGIEPGSSPHKPGLGPPGLESDHSEDEGDVHDDSRDR